MRDPKRLDGFYDEVKEIHKRYFPDWRFSQLMMNLFGFIGFDPFYLEEDKFLEYLNKYVDSLVNNRTGFIYCIVNDVNNKKYIGQTVRTLQTRWSGHLNKALTSKYPLYSDMREYGVDHYKMVMIEECEVDRLDEREQYWIKTFNSLSPNGYNIRKGGKDRGEIKVYQIDPITKETINEFDSMTLAAESIGKNMSNISKALRGEQATAYGYIWLAEDDKYNRPCSKKITRRPVVKIDPETGNIIQIYYSVKEAKEDAGVSSKNSILSAIAKGNKCRGFNWKFVDDVEWSSGVDE